MIRIDKEVLQECVGFSGLDIIEKLLEAIDNKSLPKEIDTGVLIITKANVDTYMQEMKKEFTK